MILLEDFFDNNNTFIDDDTIEQSDDFNKKDLRNYKYQVVFYLGLSNSAATELENVFKKALDIFDNFVSQFMSICRFITEFSDVDYAMAYLNPDNAYEIEHGGHTILVDKRYDTNKNYLSVLKATVKFNANFRTARDCYKFLKIFSSRNRLTNYGSIQSGYIDKINHNQQSAIYFDLVNDPFDANFWPDCNNYVLDLSKLFINENYTYEHVLSDMKNNNFQIIEYNSLFNDVSKETLEKNTIKLAHFDKIRNCSIDGKRYNNTPFCEMFGAYNLDGNRIDSFMRSPWSETVHYPTKELLNFLENTGLTIYIVKNSDESFLNGDNNSFLICVYDKIFKFEGTDSTLVLISSNKNGIIKTLSCFYSEDKAIEITNKYFSESPDSDEESDEYDDDY